MTGQEQRHSSRSFVPQIRDLGLARKAPHRVELAGSTRQLRWPPLCPGCGGAASERLPITKVFLRDWRRRRKDVDDVTLSAFRTIHVPFCGACASRHRGLLQRISVVRRILSCFTTIQIVPLAIAIFAVLLYVFPWLLGSAAAIVARPTRPPQAAGLAAFAALFAAVAWYQTRRTRIPPQTDVTTTFDFSDNLGNVVRGEHRIYAMSNARFAEAFKAANADRLWTDERRGRGARREVVAAIIGGALLVAALVIAMMR